MFPRVTRTPVPLYHLAEQVSRSQPSLGTIARTTWALPPCPAIPLAIPEITEPYRFHRDDLTGRSTIIVPKISSNPPINLTTTTCTSTRPDHAFRHQPTRHDPRCLLIRPDDHMASVREGETRVALGNEGSDVIVADVGARLKASGRSPFSSRDATPARLRLSDNRLYLRRIIPVRVTNCSCKNTGYVRTCVRTHRGSR